MSILTRKKKQSGESFCCITDASTSEDVTVIFLILKVHMGISKSFAPNPSATDDKDPVPLNPTTTLASAV